MASALGMQDIQDAFKTHEAYEQYANPILSSIQDSNYSSLQEELQKASEPWLSNDYIQTMKATDLFSDTIKSVAYMGVVFGIVIKINPFSNLKSLTTMKKKSICI